MLWWLAGGLACAGMLVIPGEAGPIYVAVDIFPGFCLGGVLYVDKHGFLDDPGLIANLLVNNVELVGVHGVSCGGDVEVYGGGGLEMFLNPFPQGSARFTNVGTGEIYVGALVLVDDVCLTCFGILVLGVS